MSFKHLVVALLCASIVSLFACSTMVPVVNYPGTPVETSSGKATLKDVKRAIVFAGTRIGWQMQPAGDDQILASLFSSGHIIKVDIKYSTKSYSITYRESSNFDYNGKTIKPEYNEWVSDLHDKIRDELKKIK